MKIQNSANAPIYNRAYGELKLLCGGEGRVMESEKADFKILSIEPAFETSHHCHLQRESIFHILTGRILLRSIRANIEQELGGGDTFLIAPGEDHILKNIGNKTATVLEIESPPHSSSDKIPFETVLPQVAISSRSGDRFWGPGEHIRLKICGIKNLDTAIECYRLGVDAIGLHAIGWRGIERVLGYSDWLPCVPRDMSVFVLTDILEAPILNHLILHTSCDTVQLQGEHANSRLFEAFEQVRRTGCRVVRTLSAARGADEVALEEHMSETQPYVDAVLFDSGPYGGTGKTHDWSLSKRLGARLKVPMIIAGGLNSDNCGEAIAITRPYGLDIESGVEDQFKVGNERRITVKNFAKISALVQAVRN